MGGKKICMTVSDEAWNELNNRALREGFSGVPALCRHLAVSALNEQKEQSPDRRCLKVLVDNYRELAGYVDTKKFGRIESFATFAMGQYMARFPLTDAQKTRVGKLAD